MNLKGISQIFSADEKSQQQQRKNANEQSDGSRPPLNYVELSHFTEPLVLDEGATAPIQSWNIYAFSRHHHESISKGDILFRYCYFQRKRKE